MNRIYRLVFNRATGAMQVASELASGLSSPGRAVGATRRRSTLGVAVVAALGLGAASAPAFAVPYDFTADEVIGDTRAYADGFFVGNTGTVAIDLVGSGRLTSNGLVSLGTVAGANGTLRVIGPTAYLQMTGAALRIGEAGAGTLQLLYGGTATSNNTVSLGYGAGGTGNALVSGAGSSLTARQLLVGRQGTGTLDIDGGRVASTMAYTVVNNFGISLGSDTAGSGTINVRNGGELIVTDNNLLVGQVGQGRLNVDGGRVEAGRGIYVGAGTQSGATQGGRGEITVSGGGQLVSQDLVLGASNNATGTLTVSGAGSVVDATTVRVGQN
ncbi:MAG: autotransporter outer membrane beta-barrel domain-containing protein, partial [Stenotrophomonas sp.]|nr:autotransporter outer membrane beta-barrel domain-containing protein [Stenotrophomonas sp.]